MDNIEESRNRCEYASKLLKENNVPHVIKNADIGHINILGKLDKNDLHMKTVMSFWARTGKMIFTTNVEWLEKNKITNDDLNRGVQNLISTYKKYFGGNL